MSNGKVALVTGSGKRRVGSVVAEVLAQRGYSVAVHYRSSSEQALETVGRLRALGVEAEAFPADLAEETSVAAMLDAVLARFEKINVLVNCAAIWERKPLEDVTAADVLLHFNTNALGTFLCCQRVGLEMVRQPEGGVIVNIGDWAEIRPYPGYSAYFPSKGAVSAITKCLAVELGTRNPKIRVNQISPGPVMLPPDLPEAEKRESIDATLVKREGHPMNIALAVLALLENDFVTGANLPVDGGRSIYSPAG